MADPSDGVPRDRRRAPALLLAGPAHPRGWPGLRLRGRVARRRRRVAQPGRGRRPGAAARRRKVGRRRLRRVRGARGGDRGRAPDALWVGYLGYAARAGPPGPARPASSPTPCGYGSTRAGSSPWTRRGTARRALLATHRPAPLTDEEWYAAAFDTVQEHLHAGRSYEVNLTYRVATASSADPAGVYLDLRRRSPAPYAGFLQHDVAGARGWLLSASPERFLGVDARARGRGPPDQGDAAPGHDAGPRTATWPHGWPATRSRARRT